MRAASTKAPERSLDVPYESVRRCVSKFGPLFARKLRHRGANLAALRKNGLRIKSPLGDLHLPKVTATDDAKELGRVDLVVLGVKLWDTEAAARAIAPLVSDETAVVSFQNGVDKDDVLRSVLGDAAIVGGVSYIAAIAEPGVIAHKWDDAATRFRRV